MLATLRAHKEIECDDPEDDTTPANTTDREQYNFVWLRTTKKGKKALGGPTVYGRIEVLRDSIVGEVNSDRRCKLLRTMLEAIRGVRFVGTEPLPFDPKTGRPLNRSSVATPMEEPMSSEALEAVRLHFRNRDMAWLDTKIPVLGNKTPRQAVKTKEGRERVAMLIRTMPTLTLPSGQVIEPPRQEMLRELGIESPPAAEA